MRERAARTRLVRRLPHVTFRPRPGGNSFDVSGAEEFVPKTSSLTELERAASACRGCDLYKDATQTVFGAGPRAARLMLVGEQPGDQEDKAGEPFVGPAGGMLMKALASAGIDRTDTYVTNAVKHFKFEVVAERGKRRIHKKPSRSEVVACQPWLLAEMAAVQPRVVVCLGATAAQSLFGGSFRLTQHRGEVLHLDDKHRHGLPEEVDPAIVVTIHPSAVLRGPSEDRDKALAGLVADLKVASVASSTGSPQ